MRDPDRWMALLAAVWLGGLLCVAVIATPSAFAVLSPADAGRVAGRILASEAVSSVVLAALMLALQRWSARSAAAGEQVPAAKTFNLALGCAAGALFCTLAGYYALQPMMADARAGRGVLSFGQLHAISVAFFAVKLVVVALMAIWLNVRISRKPVS